jgi:hypothetical protein
LWEPVDTEILLDFLCLPVSPISRRASGRLADSLAEQPGYRSDAWQRAVAELTAPETDADGTRRKRLDTWFDIERFPHGQPLPAASIASVCSRVAQWAAGYAAVIEDEALASSLMIAAGQARMVAELACTAGGAISEPQLGRLLDAALDRPSGFSAHSALAGSAALITSLAELRMPCDRLIWLGLGVTEPRSSRWTFHEISQMQACGLEIDDGRSQMTAIRDAERRGITQIRSCLFVISIPCDQELHMHPVWLQIRNALGESRVVPLTRAFADNPETELSPWSPELDSYRIIPSPDPLKECFVERELLSEPSRSSATELNDRLGCPIKWMFEYPADLHSSPIARLPEAAQLQGNFSHGVLAAVFGSGGDLPSPEEAIAQVERCFDDSLPRNAAPLAQPWASVQRSRLREELKNSTRVLVEALRGAGYQIIAMEKQVEAELQGRQFIGYIDCLAANQAGSELVIDFKYSREKHYRDLLSNGRAIQLATYAALRAAEGKRSKLPGVAYLILSRSILLISELDAPQGLQRAQRLKDAAPIKEVWQNFVTALRGSEAWLRGEEPVPSRPKQSSEEWPAGVDLVLDAFDSPDPSKQDICRYCEYTLLCGARRLI